MKIALLHYASPPIVGGVEIVLAQHARLMTDAGHEVTIFTGRGKSFDKRIKVCVLPRLNSRNREVIKVKGLLDKGRHITAFDILRDQIKEELVAGLKGFHLLIAHNVASLHKNLALTAALYEVYRKPGFPRLILWHHDLAWTSPRYRAEMHAGYPWDLLRSQWVGAYNVAVSALRQKEIGNLLGIPLESIRVIPNGVDLNTFFKLEPQTVQFIDRLNLIHADPFLLLPVRLTPRKNIELALSVMEKLRTIFPKAVLLVTGPEGPHNPANATYKQKLLDLRTTLKLRNAVYFLAEETKEFVPDAVIADFYRLADALLFPSLEEGFGIPIIEAAISRMPVFCTDIPVLRELGREDVSYFSQDTDPQTIANQISKRLKTEVASRYGRRAKRDYAWQSIYQMYIEPFIQEVTA